MEELKHKRQHRGAEGRSVGFGRGLEPVEGVRTFLGLIPESCVAGPAEAGLRGRAARCRRNGAAADSARLLPARPTGPAPRRPLRLRRARLVGGSATRRQTSQCAARASPRRPRPAGAAYLRGPRHSCGGYRGDPPKRKGAAVQRLSEMELAGLEPATSWVRFGLPDRSDSGDLQVFYRASGRARPNSHGQRLQAVHAS
jgi:hypothetical protein